MGFYTGPTSNSDKAALITTNGNMGTQRMSNMVAIFNSTLQNVNTLIHPDIWFNKASVTMIKIHSSYTFDNTIYSVWVPNVGGTCSPTKIFKIANTTTIAVNNNMTGTQSNLTWFINRATIPDGTTIYKFGVQTCMRLANANLTTINSRAILCRLGVVYTTVQVAAPPLYWLLSLNNGVSNANHSDIPTGSFDFIQGSQFFPNNTVCYFLPCILIPNTLGSDISSGSTLSLAMAIY